MSGGIDYAEWFGRVNARVRELEDELAKLKPLLATLAPLVSGEDPDQLVMEGTPAPQRLVPVAVDTAAEPVRNGTGAIYSEMNSLDAALHYMRSVNGGPKTTIDVAAALREGGYTTTSPNFVNNVYTTMRRLVERGDARKVGQGVWRLTHQGLTGKPIEEVERAPGQGLPAQDHQEGSVEPPAQSSLID